MNNIDCDLGDDYVGNEASAKPPSTPDNQIPGQICPHIHFRTDIIDRQILSRKQHLNLLCTPKGYRWFIKKKDESEADRMDPTKHVFVCADKRKKTGKTYVHNFLAEIWSLMTPEMVERIKEMLMNEFGMTAEESVRFICEQRMRTLELAERHHPHYDEDIEEEDEVKQDPKIPRLIVGDQKLCCRGDFSVGIDPCHIKEFSRTVSNKLSGYVMAMMCARRNNRHRRMAEVILNGLCTITGEKCTLDKPKNRLHKILTLVSDRTALWLAENIEDEDKKREMERKREDAELRRRHKEKMEDRERRRKEHEKFAKEREKQEKKRAKKEEEEARKAKEEEEKKKAEREKRHQEFEKNKEKKKADGGGKDGADKKGGGKEDGDKKKGAGGSKSSASKGGGKGSEQKGGGKGGGDSGKKKGVDQGKGAGSKGGTAKGGAAKGQSQQSKGQQGKKPSSGPGGSQGGKNKPSGADSKGDEKSRDEAKDKPEETPKTGEEGADDEQKAAPTDEDKPAEERPSAEQPPKTEEDAPKTTEEEQKTDETKPEEAKSEETKPEDTKPAEDTPAEEGSSAPETQAGGPETKPEEADTKSEEPGTKPEEPETKLGEPEAKKEESEVEKKEPAKKEPSAVKPPPDALQEAIEKSVSQIIETKPESTPRQEAIKDIISKELEKRIQPKDDETKALIREMSDKAATWMDKKVKGVEEEYGYKEKKVPPVTQKPKGPIFSLRKSEDHINVRRATHLEAEKGIRQTRGKIREKLDIDPEKPMSPQDAKLWAKWAEDASQMAEDWGKWIDKTIQDAEEKAVKYKSRGKESGKEIDVDAADWAKFTGKTQEEALEWRRNRKALEQMAAKWKQKSQKQ